MAPCGFPPGVFHSRNLCGISPSFEGLSPTTGQVTYALLSRLPLTRRSVRLACVRRAASVRPEPGSNPHQKDFRSNLALFKSLALPSAIQLLRCAPKTQKPASPLAFASEPRDVAVCLGTYQRASLNAEKKRVNHLVDCLEPSRPRDPASSALAFKELFASSLLSHTTPRPSTRPAQNPGVR